MRTTHYEYQQEARNEALKVLKLAKEQEKQNPRKQKLIIKN